MEDAWMEGSCWMAWMVARGQALAWRGQVLGWRGGLGGGCVVFLGGGLDGFGGRVRMEGAWLEGRRLDGGQALGWRGDGGMDGVVLRFGSRGLCRVSVQRFAVFYGSQGWTVPGGSVPVCGSVRGLHIYIYVYIYIYIFI